MKRHHLSLAIFAATLALCLVAGHRLGRAAGESSVARRLAARQAAAESYETRQPAANLPGSPSLNKIPRSREAMTRFLDDLKGHLFQTSATSHSLAVGLNGSVASELDQLSLDEVRMALGMIAEWPQGIQRMGLSMALLGRWGREDPAAALAYAKTHRDEAGPFASLWMTTIFPQWADRDPRTAARELAATLKNEDDAIVRGAIGSAVFMVAEKLANADMPAALRHVAELPEWAQSSALSAVAKQVHGDGRQKFLDTIRAMPTGTEKTTWQNAAATALAPVDSAAAAQWIDSLGLDVDATREASRAVFEGWKLSDPRAATAWAMSRLPEPERAVLVQHTVESWAPREPNECGRWLGEFGPDPALDHAVAEFSRVVAKKDAESARVWAARITDPTLREQALSQISGTK